MCVGLLDPQNFERRDTIVSKVKIDQDQGRVQNENFLLDFQQCSISKTCMGMSNHLEHASQILTSVVVSSNEFWLHA